MTRNWMDFAACGEHDPELWHPVGDGKTIDQQTIQAKRICHDCPVKRNCLERALHNPGWSHGIWAGLTFEERKQLRQREVS